MNIDFNEAIYRGRTAFDNMAKLQNLVKNATEDDIKLFISPVSRIGKTFLFLTGCLPLLAKKYNKNVEVNISSKSYAHLKNMGIIDYYNNIEKLNSASQNFRRIISENDIFKLVPLILNEAPIEMSGELQEILISKIGEMYNNAFEHSDASYILGGKYFKSQKNLFCFSCYDTGIGIVNKVKDFLLLKDTLFNANDFNDIKALKWAMIKRNSTSVEANPHITRGLGLTTLIEFARVNHGKIRICTGKTLYTFDNGDKFEELKSDFLGTLFEMEIVADNDHEYMIT